jgi:rhamnose utilization protein RhaD (predicted bifunctional aldolase and dehydrogenase)/NAD(P)-dependent dehydrogenase (short-subunit alcohol dehydrogenase family)
VKSLWNDDAAEECARSCAGEERDVALCIYSARLLGSERRLVLHGGGNVSVKVPALTLFGETATVLRMKGSGADLRTLAPDGLPALEHAALVRLRELPRLDDAEMARALRRAKLDPSAREPSVETLLHAFLPHRFVDHTHADALLEISNQPGGAELMRAALGDGVAVIPWVRPGFALANAAVEAHARAAGCSAIAVCHHGLFTFADDARAAYERMIELVDRAEKFVAERTAKARAVPAASAPPAVELAASVLPTVRGALAAAHDGPLGRTWQRVIAECRDGPEPAAFSLRDGAAELVRRGPLTPDHVIRTKSEYLYLTRAQAADAAQCRSAVARFTEGYARYYAAHHERIPDCPPMLDPRPRVVVVEGLGVLAFGADKRAAVIAADIAEQTLSAIARASALGSYTPLAPEHVFDMEYWPLELAKARAAPPALLAGQIALVTGAGGAIGYGIAGALLDAGAHVVLTDVSQPRLSAVQGELARAHSAERIATITADVTSLDDVARVFALCRGTFGGVDIVVPNAGIAHVARLADLQPEDLRRALDVNVIGTSNVLKLAAKVFAEQGTGGSVIIQSSKNVFDPGAGFGAYSASKAAVHQLGKIAALEFAPLGVRVNMINADAVFGDDVIKSGLWEQIGDERMRARGLDPEGLRAYYRDRSLLKVSVLPAHVGQAVVFFAAGTTPTTGATLPVDAGIPGAFPR